MTKNEYLLRLDQYLADLPEDKRIEALTACENHFRQNGLDREQETIQQLGSPEAVAGSIRRRWQEEKPAGQQKPVQPSYEPFPDFKPDVDFARQETQPNSHLRQEEEPHAPEMPKMPDFDTRILRDDFWYAQEKISQESQDLREESPQEPPVSDFIRQEARAEQTDRMEEKPDIPRQPHGYRYDRSRGGWLAPEEWEEADYPEEYGEDEEEDDDDSDSKEKKPVDPQLRAKRKKQLKLAGVGAAILVLLMILIPIVKGVGKGVSFLLSGVVLCICAGLILAVKGLGTFFNGLTMLAAGPLNGGLCCALGLALCGAGCILFGVTLAVLVKGVPVLMKSGRKLIRQIRQTAAKGGQSR